MKSMQIRSSAPSCSCVAPAQCRTASAQIINGHPRVIQQWRQQLPTLRSRTMMTHAIPVSGPKDPFDETPDSISSDTARISKQLVIDMQAKIQLELEADSVSVKDTYGDGKHVSIEVVSNIFEGQSSMKRQRMVYKAIWVELQNVVHAVDSMTTKTPAEVAAQ